MRIGVFGAGAVGVYLGTCLSSAGASVVMVGRPELCALGSTIRAVTIGGRARRPDERLILTTSEAALSDVDICLVTVKSRDTSAAADALVRVLRPDALVISCQNGLANAHVLAATLGARRTLAGVVVFNIAREGATFRKATRGDVFAGPLTARDDPRLAQLVLLFKHAGERFELRRDIAELQRSKLLLNLNNGICAATGLGILASVRSRDARWCFAKCLSEALAVLAASGLRTARLTHLPIPWIARGLLLPDALVHRVAHVIVGSDPAARSSTLIDLERKKPTEIGDLNHAIVELARERRMLAPANAVITAVVRELEINANLGLPLSFVTPSELRLRMSAAIH